MIDISGCSGVPMKESLCLLSCPKVINWLMAQQHQCFSREEYKLISFATANNILYWGPESGTIHTKIQPSFTEGDTERQHGRDQCIGTAPWSTFARPRSAVDRFQSFLHMYCWKQGSGFPLHTRICHIKTLMKNFISTLKCIKKRRTLWN